MTRYDRNASTEDNGLTHVYRQVVAMGYIWRDFLRHDVGIDLVIEVVKEGRATGLLVGAQVKSGQSYFQGHNTDCARIYIPWDHWKYWLECSIPVIVIAYHPSRQAACWKEIDIYDLVGKAYGKGHCLTIDVTSCFNAEAASDLERISAHHRNRARGFKLSERSGRDEDNPYRWEQLSLLLEAILERSRPSFTPSIPSHTNGDELFLSETAFNDRLIGEAEFLAELIRWDLAYPKHDQPHTLVDRLQSIVRLCRDEWAGSWLEEWLLTQLGGLVPAWWPELARHQQNSNSVIDSPWDFRCPICFAGECDQGDEVIDLSYTLGAVFYDLFEQQARCHQCGAEYSYRWGGSGIRRDVDIDTSVNRVKEGFSSA